MRLVQLFVYIDSSDVSGNIQTFDGPECVQLAIDYCHKEFVLPADVCKVSGMIEIVDPMSGDKVQRSWPNPDLGWFRGELRKKYVESRVANPNAEMTDGKADGVSSVSVV